MIYAGIDVGSCTTKAVIIDREGRIIGSHVCRSGIDYRSAAEEALRKALGNTEPDGIKIVATGYGRHNVDFAEEKKTEIACHAKGGYYYLSERFTLIDIGGQDNKVIKIDERGRRIDFKMNRKCAAGTGAFIEEIAYKMNIPLERLDSLARKAKRRFKIGSYCTVFASTEILSHIRRGVALEELVRGIFESVVDRIMEMDQIEGKVLMSGGVVQYFPIVAEILEKRINGKVIVPPRPQLTGAFGAALFAKELEGESSV